MEIQVLKSGSAVVAHKGQVWLLDAPKGVGDELAALGITPDTVLTTTVAAPGIAGLQEGFKILRQVPLRGDGLEAEAIQRTHGWDYIVKDDAGASFLFSQRGDVSAADVEGHDLALVGNKYRANAFDEWVLTRPWSTTSFFVAPKVWSKLSEVPGNLREMDDAKLSLAQANAIARQAEGIPEGEVEEPYAVAIANFKRTHHKEDGQWVKNKEADSEKVKAGFVCPNCGSRNKSTQTEGDDPTCAGCGERMIPDRRRRSAPPDPTRPHAASRGVVSGLAAGIKGNKKLSQEALTILKAKFPDMADDSIKDEGQLAIFKSNGQWRWATITSAAMWDKQDELVTRKAMDFAIALSTITGERGPLRHEHVPGLDSGECDWQMRKGDFLFESGYFHDTPFATQCRKKYMGDPDYRISAGLRYQAEDLVDGVYHRLGIFERSATKTPAVPITALGVMQMQVSDEMLKELAKDLEWPVEEVSKLVERAMKSASPPESLEALKSALQSSKTETAMDELLANLTDSDKAMLKTKLSPDTPTAPATPAPDAGGDKSEIAALKTQVEQLTVEMGQSNKAVMALAQALKGGSTQQGSVQDAIAAFLSELPRQEAAQFTVAKGGLTLGGEALSAIQVQLNEMSEKMDTAIKGPTFDYDAFTSRRLNAAGGSS